MENNNQPNNEQSFLVNNERLKNIDLLKINKIGSNFLTNNPNQANIELPEFTPTPNKETPKKR